jgi:hypothetical protein
MAGMALHNVANCWAIALFTSRRDHNMTLTNLAAVIVLSRPSTVAALAGLYGAAAAILLAFSRMQYPAKLSTTSIAIAHRGTALAA